MKYSAALCLIVIVSLVASSTALPARKRMVYLQQQPQWYGAPQRLMYVQYEQPSRTHARSTQAATALVAGESVATGTYLKDCDQAEADIAAAGPIAAEHQGAPEDALSAAGAHGAQSFAEAYPEENEVQQPIDVEVQLDSEVATVTDDAEAGAGAEGPKVDIAAAADVPYLANGGVAGTVEIEVENTEVKVPRDYRFDAEEGAAAAETPADDAAPVAVPIDVNVDVAASPIDVAVTANLPAPAPIAPVAATPVRRYLPANKKVYVELEQSAESDADEEEGADAVVEDAEEEDEETYVAPPAPVNPVRVPNARRPTKKATKPVKAAQGGSGSGRPTKAPKPLPAGTFFPIDFGGTNGGAIAIANAFSTGEGGSATSHAIAYGSPDSARARVRPSKRH